ncbi:MAG: hypothetical protein EOM80_01570 [Erysipelotrichia bacterium]|nr:hypothetical protein [Erysipelotrichia bacterium]
MKRQSSGSNCLKITILALLLLISFANSTQAQESILGEIRLMPYSYAPEQWLPCDGQLLNISDYQALFAIIGTIYGGDGQKNFALPDLRGRFPFHAYEKLPIGTMGGSEYATVQEKAFEGWPAYAKYDPKGDNALSAMPKALPVQFCINVSGGYFPDYSESTRTSPIRASLKASALTRAKSPVIERPASYQPSKPPMADLSKLSAKIANDPAVSEKSHFQVILFQGNADSNRASLVKSVIENVGEKNPDILLFMFDIDNAKDLAEKYKVAKTPTVLWISDETVVSRCEGSISKADLSKNTRELKSKK